MGTGFILGERSEMKYKCLHTGDHIFAMKRTIQTQSSMPSSGLRNIWSKFYISMYLLLIRRCHFCQLVILFLTCYILWVTCSTSVKAVSWTSTSLSHSKETSGCVLDCSFRSRTRMCPGLQLSKLWQRNTNNIWATVTRGQKNYSLPINWSKLCHQSSLLI